MTTPKTADEWKAAFLKDWPSRLVLTCLTGLGSFVVVKGEGLIEKKILETVKPSLDSIRKQGDKTDEKVDALIDVMGRAFPEFKKAAKERAEEKRDSKEVQDALTGDTP